MATYSTCVFCNRNDSKPSKEDVVPKWIGREFTHNNWDITPLHPLPRFRTKKNMGIFTKKPCRRCNNEWMASLESVAKPVLTPLIHGTPATLTPDDQFLITRWFIKTVIMYDCAGEKLREPYFNSDERHALTDERISVPQNTMFFIARYRGDKDIITREMRLRLALGRPDPNATLIDIEGYTATFAIKHLVLQVFSVRRPEEFADETLHFLAPAFEGACFQIWPVESDVCWPTRFYLDDAAFGLFTDRWTAMPRPSS